MFLVPNNANVGLSDIVATAANNRALTAGEVTALIILNNLKGH